MNYVYVQIPSEHYKTHKYKFKKKTKHKPLKKFSYMQPVP